MGRESLKVRPFTSVSRYKGKEPDIPTFGRELNVQMIVTGKLLLQGDELSISVAVVDVREDNQFWGYTYRGKRDAILDLQDQIARDVAANLRLRLSGEEEQRLTKRDTADPEAYLFYSEATYHFNRFTEEAMLTSIGYCQRAIKKDPNYALAYAGLGRAYLLLGSIHRGPRETHSEAKKWFSRALEIDKTLPEAHAGLAVIFLFHDWDWPAAERELKHAGEDDSRMTNRTGYFFYLAAMDRLPEALIVVQRATDLDPLSARQRMELDMCYNWMRQYDLATKVALKALELDATFFFAYRELGLSYIQQGRYEEAIAELGKAVNLGRGHPHLKGLLGCAYAAAGKKAEARQVLQEMTGPKRRFGDAFAVVRIHAALGEKVEAFEWLQKACDERDAQVIWLKVDPTLDSLRSDPRFAQVLKNMRLPP